MEPTIYGYEIMQESVGKVLWILVGNRGVILIALDLHISTFLILYALLILIEYVIWKRHKRNISFLGLAVVTLYLLLLFKVAICPIVFLREDSRQEFLNMFGSHIRYYQLVPFKTIGNTFQTNAWVFQILGNVLLLFPIPLLYSLLVKKIPRMRVFILMGAFISLGIELIQLGIDMAGQYPSHVADIDDFILNVTGVAISTMILYRIHKRDFFTKIKQRFRTGLRD